MAEHGITMLEDQAVLTAIVLSRLPLSRLVSSTMLNMGTLQKSAGGRFWFGYVWICEHATCQASSERSESSVKAGPMVGLGTNSQTNSQSNNKFPNIY
jgi:hypothetical protein